jgi:hypothetical protein
MAKKPKLRLSKEETARELSPAAIERELASLKTSLTKPLTPQRLTKWIDAKASRVGLFSDTIFGSIRWRKSLGRPFAAKLADGFLIEHNTWYSAKVFENGALHYVDILEPHYGLSKWDGQDDGNNYNVHFMTAVARGSNRIKVSFATGIGWGIQTEHTRRVLRRIDPPERYFEQEDKLVMLDPFEVVTTSF